jgi:hypothetical protein
MTEEITDQNENNNSEDECSLILTRAFGDKLASVDEDSQDKYTKLARLMTGVAEGFEEVAQEWRPAVVKITQAMTSSASGKPDNAKMGDLFHKGGLIHRPFNVAVVYAWPTRVRFAPDDEIPSCSSENVDLKGKGASDKSVSIYGDKCSECPLESQPFRYGKQTPCNNVMNVLLVPENLDNIFVMQFSKSSWSPGRQLVDLATKKSPPWSRFFAIDTTIEKRKTGKGEYAVPTISAVDSTEVPVPDHLQKFGAMLSDHFKTYRVDRKKLSLARSQGMAEKFEPTPARGGGAKKIDYSDTM